MLPLPPYTSQEVAAVFWQIGFGNDLINTGTGTSGTGISGKSSFSGNDSGLFPVDLTDANALDQRFPPGTLCLGSNNWANAGIDGCCDNPRADQFTHGGYSYVGDDNTLDPYYGTYLDGIGYPGYYSLASVVDYPTAVLLTTTDERWFAVAAVTSMDRGNSGTGANGPCVAASGSNPAPCDRRQGFFSFADVTDGLPNANDPNRNKVIPWQSTPAPSIDTSTPVDPDDPDSAVEIEVSWTAAIVHTDGRSRPSVNPTLGPVDPNSSAGAGTGDIASKFGLVRYLLEAAAETDPNFSAPTLAVTCPGDAECDTAISAVVTVSPDSCLRLSSLFGPQPRVGTPSTVDCRVGKCGDLGYSVTSAPVCLGTQQASSGGGGGSTPPPEPSSSSTFFDPDLPDALEASGTVRVFIGLSGRRLLEPMATREQILSIENDIALAQQNFRTSLPANGIIIVTEFRHIFSVLAEIDASGFSALTQMPQVTRIELTRRLEPHLLEGAPLIGANRVQSCPLVQHGQPNIVTIAILDSGIDWRHDAFGGAFGPLAPKVIGGTDCTGPGPCAEDPNLVLDTDGHGTSVAGIAAGAPGGNYTLIGVAPDAFLLAVKVLGGGSMDSGDLTEGLQWVLDRVLGGDSSLRVVNMSLGIPPQVSTCPTAGSPLYDLLLQLSNEGVSLIASSGNDGDVNAIGTPACIPFVTSVGAVFDTDFGTHAQVPIPREICTGFESFPANPHSVSCRTNSASGLDLVAPSPAAATATMTDGGIDLAAVNPAFGGTSGAAPYVSGAFALMLRDPAYGSSTPQQLESRLIATGFPAFHKMTFGPFPRINVARAMQPDSDADGFGNPGLA
jgi:hypothetical protein